MPANLNAYALVGELLGNDPLVGKLRLEELQQPGISAWSDIFKAALQAEDATYHGIDRLAKLCAYHGDEAAQFLVKQIETGDWAAKTLAAQGLRYIRNSEIASAAAELAQHSDNFDVQRLAIAALGEMGADGWSHAIVEATLGPENPFFFAPSEYTVGKLASYAAEALARMVVREEKEGSVDTDLFMLDTFLKRMWDKGRIKEFFVQGLPELKRATLSGLRDITATAATPIQRQFLHSSWPFEQEIAAGALYYLPLDRVASELGRHLLEDKNEPEVRYQCAESLMGFSTRHANESLKPALSLHSNPNKRVQQGIHLAYSGLFFFDTPDEWNTPIQDQILSGGGEPKAQLLYGFGIWQRHRKLIDQGLADNDVLIRSASALALARCDGVASVVRLRKARKDAATGLERVFTSAALIHAGDLDARADLHSSLCRLPYGERVVRQIRHIWKREIISALNSGPWSQQASAWAEAMDIDLVSTGEEMAHISKHLDLKTEKTPTVTLAEANTKEEEPVIFLSYSHEDDKWRKKLELMLSPLTKGQKLDLWTDKRIDPGAKWKKEIEKALERANVAVLLVSPHFLASDFISKHELPPLLERSEKQGLQILWIPVSASLYAHTEIGAYQAVIDPKKPLDTFKGAKLNDKIVVIATAIASAVNGADKKP